jgi:hypothetical protein
MTRRAARISRRQTASLSISAVSQSGQRKAQNLAKSRVMKDGVVPWCNWKRHAMLSSFHQISLGLIVSAAVLVLPLIATTPAAELKLWHFNFRGPDTERLVAGRERILASTSRPTHPSPWRSLRR